MEARTAERTKWGVCVKKVSGWAGHDALVRTDRAGTTSPFYSDSLYGAPVFPMLYQATGSREYLDMLDHVFWTVTEATLDEDNAPYHRGPRYIGQESPNGAKVLWSRGNGWVFAAFPRIFRYLPEDAPGRERYVDLYRRMAASLAPRQQPAGFWRSNLAKHFRRRPTAGGGIRRHEQWRHGGTRTGRLRPFRARYIRVVGNGNTDNAWNSMRQMVILPPEE